mgnify:CR=1 FL=1
MFIARHGPHTPSAAWGGLIKGFVACEIQFRPPQTAEKSNASDTSIVMSLLTELLPELFYQAMRRNRHGLARQCVPLKTTRNPIYLAIGFDK